MSILPKEPATAVLVSVLLALLATIVLTFVFRKPIHRRFHVELPEAVQAEVAFALILVTVTYGVTTANMLGETKRVNDLLYRPRLTIDAPLTMYTLYLIADTAERQKIAANLGNSVRAWVRMPSGANDLLFYGVRNSGQLPAHIVKQTVDAVEVAFNPGEGTYLTFENGTPLPLKQRDNVSEGMLFPTEELASQVLLGPSVYSRVVPGHAVIFRIKVFYRNPPDAQRSETYCALADVVYDLSSDKPVQTGVIRTGACE